METEGARQTGCLKTWWDCFIEDMESFGLFYEDAQDKDQWRLRINRKLANPVLPEDGHYNGKD